jgi:hypothetical protein
MGLDYVELVTVGDFYNLLLTKIPRNASAAGCLTSAAFYRLRRGLVERFGADRKQIRPATLLETVVPRRNRRKEWKALSTALELKLPGLDVMPGWLFATVVVVSLSGACWAGWRWTSFPAALGSGLVLYVAGSVLSLPLLVDFGVPTVGELAERVAALNRGRLAAVNRAKPDGMPWTDVQAWNRLRQVFVRQVGVDIEDITPEEEIRRGLGID